MVLESDVLGELSADNVKLHVEHIALNIPSRLAGSENGRRMAEYSMQALRKVDVTASVHEMPGLVSFPEGAEFRVIEPREIAIAANTMGHSLETLPGGISGEMVDVLSGALSDYEGKSVAGKITMTELSYTPARQEKQRIASMFGSVAQVMINWGHPDSEALPFGSLKQAWGNPTPDSMRTEMPRIPCIGISRTAGMQLRRMVHEAPVRVWLRTHVENVWRPVQITVGEVEAGGGDDFVLVGGHQDSWQGEAATDNAAGNACMIELARVFQRHRHALRRGLVFGFWAGHETGTMIGSTWFADRNWERLRKNAVAYLQIDQPGCVGTSRWRCSSNAELRRFHQKIERRILGDMPLNWQPPAKIGDSSFFGAGIPMLWGETTFSEEELRATAGASFGWWHHSLDNTRDKLDYNLMQWHLHVYGAYLWELCTAPVLPFDFTDVAALFEDRLLELQAAGRTIGLDGAIRRAKAFRKAADRLAQRCSHWRQVYDRDGDTDSGPADRLNGCIKRISRLLVPLQSSVRGTYGQDPYGSTPQTTMIPCLYETPKLAALAEGPERWMLEAQLVRERNRVVDAFDEAIALIEDTLSRLD